MRHHMSIGAIIKNEAPFLLEWIAWHQMIGFERFFICDNDSTNETTDILRILHDAGIVDHIPFPGRADSEITGAQYQAYDHIVRHLAADSEWIAFIDGDEFILPTGERGLAEFLEQLPEHAGAIFLN